MNTKALLFLFSTFLLHALCADEDYPEIGGAWLTGSLIAPQEVVVPLGHFEIEQYLFITANTGNYTAHWHSDSMPNYYSIQPQFFFIAGLTKWMDIEIVPQAFYNNTQGKSSFEFGDFSVIIDLQLIEPEKWKHFPGVKFAVREIFPTGKYQKLNPNKKGTDIGGQGSYQTSLNLLFYKVIHLNKQHFLSTTLSFVYTLPHSLHVQGFNAYGGGQGTKGTIYPGNSFQGVFSFEYSFTRNWVFAMDTVYTHTDRTRFSEKKGVNSLSSPSNQEVTLSEEDAVVGDPSSEQISFAPAIEYNFSGNFGIIAGIWFSAFGRNSTIFQSGVIDILYQF